MTGLNQWCAGLCLIAVLLLAGCQVQTPESGGLVLHGTCVTVRMRAHISQDHWQDDGPIQIIAQNKFCAVEVAASDLMFIVFPDGSRLRLKPSPDAPTTKPAVRITPAGTIADISGGRIDNGPATLRQAIIGRMECAPASRSLAEAWLATGQLDFHGRACGKGPFEQMFPRTSTEFIAHARLTPAGAAILREAISSAAARPAPSSPSQSSLPYSDLLTSNPASREDLQALFRQLPP
jgi:hypothetical protein